MSVEILDEIQDRIAVRSNAYADAAAVMAESDDAAVAMFRRKSFLMISGGVAFRFMLPDDTSVSDIMMMAYTYGVDSDPDMLSDSRMEAFLRTEKILDERESEEMPDMTAAQALAMAEKLVDEANKNFNRWFPAKSFIKNLDAGPEKTRVDAQDAGRFQRLFRRAFAEAAHDFQGIVGELRAEYAMEDPSGAAPEDPQDTESETGLLWSDFDRLMTKAVSDRLRMFGLSRIGRSRHRDRRDLNAVKRIVNHAVEMITMCLRDFIDFPCDADAGGALLEKYVDRTGMDNDFFSKHQRELYGEAFNRLFNAQEDVREYGLENEVTPAQALAMFEKFIRDLKRNFDEWFSDDVFAKIYVYPGGRNKPGELARYGRLCREALPQAIDLVDGVLKDLRRDLCARELTQVVRRILSEKELAAAAEAAITLKKFRPR